MFQGVLDFAYDFGLPRNEIFSASARRALCTFAEEIGLLYTLGVIWPVPPVRVAVVIVDGGNINRDELEGKAEAQGPDQAGGR